METFERNGKLVIRADLPGLSKEDVNVEVTDNAITISGERRNENEERREGYYRSECSYGSFYRPLPEEMHSSVPAGHRPPLQVWENRSQGMNSQSFDDTEETSGGLKAKPQ